MLKLSACQVFWDPEFSTHLDETQTAKTKMFQPLHAKFPTLQMLMNFGTYLLSKDSWESRIIVNVCRIWPLLSDNVMLCDWDRAVCESAAYRGKKHFNYFEAVEWARLRFPVLSMGALSNHCSEFESLMTSASASCSMTPCRTSHLHFIFFLLPKLFAGVTTVAGNCLFSFQSPWSCPIFGSCM